MKAVSCLCRHEGKGYNLYSFIPCPPNDGDWPIRWSRVPLSKTASHSFIAFHSLSLSEQAQSTSVLSPGPIPEAQVPASIPPALADMHVRLGSAGQRHHPCSYPSAVAATNRLPCSPLRPQRCPLLSQIHSS